MAATNIAMAMWLSEQVRRKGPNCVLRVGERSTDVERLACEYGALQGWLHPERGPELEFFNCPAGIYYRWTQEGRAHFKKSIDHSWFRQGPLPHHLTTPNRIAPKKKSK